MMRNTVTPRNNSFGKVPLSAPRRENLPKSPLQSVTALRELSHRRDAPAQSIVREGVKRRGSCLAQSARAFPCRPTTTQLRSKFAWPVATRCDRRREIRWR